MPHTPGPWRLPHYGADFGKKTYMRENSGDWMISREANTEVEGGPIGRATFQGKAKRGKTWNAPDPEGFANATLMAAAPELLAALLAARPLIESDAKAALRHARQSRAEEQPGHQDGATALIEMVDAAIAKATAPYDGAAP